MTSQEHDPLSKYSVGGFLQEEIVHGDWGVFVRSGDGLRVQLK